MYKKLFFSFLLVIVALLADAQVLSKAIFRISKDYKSVQSIVIVLDNTTLVIENNRIAMTDRMGINGNITYYDNFDGSDKTGKIKSIGNIKFNYYDNFDGPKRSGKLKSINAVTLNYYDQFDGEQKSGKLKSIGDININYNDVFDGSYRTGKVKSVGPVVISYFDNFDSASRAGKIKSINGNTERITVSASLVQDDGNSPGHSNGNIAGGDKFQAERIQIARILIKRGVSLEIIAEATGISVQELRSL